MFRPNLVNITTTTTWPILLTVQAYKIANYGKLEQTPSRKSIVLKSRC